MSSKIDVIYRGMNSAQLDAAYNNRAAVPHYEVNAMRRRELSAQLRSELPFVADLRYGPGDRQRIDFFPNGKNAPLFVFLHGGYWQAGDKESCTFIVPGLLDAGFSVALVEYTLAPQARIDQMVHEAGTALDFIHANAERWGSDASQIFFAGHSAGAHLVSVWLHHPAVAGILAVSGLFDLEPIRLCYVNGALGLDEPAARSFSPILHLPLAAPPVSIAVGLQELPEFQRQSAAYVGALAKANVQVAYLTLPEHDHFSILDGFATRDASLCRAALALVDAARLRAERTAGLKPVRRRS